MVVVVWVQVRLFESDVIILVDESRSYEDHNYDIQCLRVSGHVYQCKREGRNHGYFWKAGDARLDDYAGYPWLNHVPKVKMIFKAAKCLNYGHELSSSDILGYPYDNDLWIKDYGTRLRAFTVYPKRSYNNVFRNITEKLKNRS